jgi:hypothetical protein
LNEPDKGKDFVSEIQDNAKQLSMWTANVVSSTTKQSKGQTDKIILVFKITLLNSITSLS